jgi:hypothetical protein
MGAVGRDDVRAFRVAAHRLDERLPAGRLAAAAGVLGLRTTAPDAAAMAGHARVTGVDAGTVGAAVEARTLAEVSSIRGTPHLVPVDDLAVFTTGALPAGDDSLEGVLVRLADAFASGMRPAEALQLAVDAARAALDGQTLQRGELSAAMTERLPAALAPYCEGCRVAHIEETLFRLAGVAGAYCRVPGPSRGGRFARTDQWLGGEPPRVDAAMARDELVRRYFAAQGPSTAAELADWLAIGRDDAKASVERLGGELAPVSYDGRPALAGAADLPLLRKPRNARGARLLPPYDPLLNTVDRSGITSEPALQKLLWQAINSSGAVLVDGVVVGAWRSRKAGRRLEVTVTPGAQWQADRTDEVRDEARAVAQLRGCSSASVDVAAP